MLKAAPRHWPFCRLSGFERTTNLWVAKDSRVEPLSIADLVIRLIRNRYKSCFIGNAVFNFCGFHENDVVLCFLFVFVLGRAMFNCGKTVDQTNIAFWILFSGEKKMVVWLIVQTFLLFSPIYSKWRFFSTVTFPT